MQRLLSLKLASNLPKKLSNSTTTTTTSSSLFHFQPHKTYSLNKPPQTQNHSFSSFTSHPLHHHPHSWRSQHKYFTQKVHAFLSNPLLKRHLLLLFSNTLLRVSSKRVLNCRLGFLRAQSTKQSFQFNPNISSHQSGWRSWLRRVDYSHVVLGLIIANVAVFLLWRMEDRRFMVNNFTISLYNFTSGRVHTLITSAFSHIRSGHITSNMIGLLVFGMNIGRVFGAKFLLKLYLAGAVGGSIFYLVHKAFLVALSKGGQLRDRNHSKTLGLGASGAVNAIMLLDMFLFPKATIYYSFIIPVPAILVGIFLIGKDVSRIIEGDTHISGSAHLGGAAVAVIAWARIRKGRF